MFAIIDVETTGSNPAKDRVTEIAVFIHDGEKVVDQFCSLINPGQYISPFITALTGINNDMVSAAPEWPEVAERIHAMTEGAVFVAHNVRFDYAFVCNEFKRAGMKYQRKQLCSVRLSRKLVPGLRSYGLGNICSHLGISIHNRHRAFGDAEATVQLFEILLKQDTTKMIQASLKDEIKQSILPPQLNRDILKTLPEETGVYYFRDEHGKIMYIGKSNNIRKRVIGHLSGDMHSEKYQRMKKYIYAIDYTLTGNELMALILESQEIKKWFPPFNSALRKKNTATESSKVRMKKATLP